MNYVSIWSLQIKFEIFSAYAQLQFVQSTNMENITEFNQ